ncbi:ABC transporter substrate-binding protein [Balneolaceae bacterium ANBcel3]|nr:ABC transporter substrate-binding protein [Balneolaceae bacterium ANBcel3]
MLSNKVTIGVLCPYSSTYPSLAQDFLHGLMCGLPESLHSEIRIQPEYVKQGEPQLVSAALQKFFAFHQADVVTGPVSYKTLPEYNSLIEASGKMALFTDLGEYLPHPDMISDYIFNNSFQYWQAEYAKGVWAQKEFGDRGTVLMPLYEAGYHMHSAFRHGTEFSGSEVVDYIVIPQDIKQDKEVTEYVDQLARHYEKQGRPSYLNLLFSGKDAIQILKVLAGNSYFDEIPLLVSPHMSSLEMIQQIQGEHLTMYSASMWNFESTVPENDIFRKKYISSTGTYDNVFSLLGYEVGMAVGILYPSLNSKFYADARRLLKNERLKTPRGERSFYLDSDYATPLIDIEKIQTGGSKTGRMVISRGQSLPYNHQIYREIHEECVSGWKNPYLCI